jgi:hypothetical protein
LSLVNFLFFNAKLALKAESEKKIMLPLFLLLYRYSTFLADTRDDGNEKRKRKKKLTKFQVLSFSNEWLTASLTAVE